jgi:hypothetical protein
VAGDNIYINGRSAFHAGSGGKALAAFPDLCLCPPPPPGGPVPTPLPNNALASDITGCATSVMFCGNPAGHQRSYISTSTGDEAGDPKAGGQGNAVTHTVKGKAYFHSYSMDVRIEGIEAIRHLDITTHNHASPPPGTPPKPMIAKRDFAKNGQVECGKGCVVVAYDKGCPKGRDGQKKTPHHIIPKHCFKEFWNDAAGEPIPLKGWSSYNAKKAPCVCVTGADKAAESPSGRLLEHGRIHRRMDLSEAVAALRPGPDGQQGNAWSYSEARDAGVESVNKGTGGKCDPACVAAVVDGYHLGKSKKDPPLRAYCPADEDSGLRQKALKSAAKVLAND